METMQELQRENRKLKRLLGAAWLAFSPCTENGMSCDGCKFNFLCKNIQESCGDESVI